jgi:hypothetical protein
MAAAAANAQQQSESSKPIAPKVLNKIPTAAESDAMKETARNLREEFERQQNDFDQAEKGTRRYNKTGRYSKKRQYSTGTQFVALQPSLESGSTTPSQQYSSQIGFNDVPMKVEPVAPNQQKSSILSKRLPEEELQHREVKKRQVE